jgi:hypothetical protein
MAKISQLKLNGQVIYAQTITAAIADLREKKLLSDILQEIREDVASEKAKFANSATIAQVGVGESASYETQLSLVYHAKGTHTVDGVEVDPIPAHISLTDKNGKELSVVNVSDIVGNGVLDSSSYSEDTGILTLNFKQADGTTKAAEIDLKKMLDINDMSIASDSTNYLTVTLSGEAAEDGKSQAVFGAKLVKVADATEDNTGLVDALDVKAYVDNKSSDLAVTAEGDDYIGAKVDADTDNKHVIVAANVKDVTATAGTVGTWAVAEDGIATLEGDVAPTLEGVEKTLVDGKQGAEAVKTYVDGKVAAEAARTDAKVLAAVKALDKVATTTDGTNVHVTISEVDGIVTVDSVVEDYTTVKVEKAEDADETTIVVTDESKLATGKDIKAVSEYVDARLDEVAADLAVTAAGDDYVEAKVSETDNKKIEVSANVKAIAATEGVAAEFDAEGAETTAATAPTISATENSLVDGKAVADAIKTYADGAVTIEAARADAKVLAAVKALDAEVEGSSTNVKVTVTEVDGVVYKVEVEETTAAVADGETALTTGGEVYKFAVTAAEAEAYTYGDNDAEATEALVDSIFGGAAE